MPKLENDAAFRPYYLSPDEKNRAVFLNGRFEELFSVFRGLPAGASFKENGSVRLAVGAGVKVDDPIHFLFIEEKDEAVGVEAPLFMTFGPGCAANVVVNHVSLGAEKKNLRAISKVDVEEGANVEYSVIQRTFAAGESVFQDEFNLKKRARLGVAYVSMGRATATTQAVINFEEENAEASLTGLAVLTDGSRAMMDSVANHRAGACKSRQFFKSIVAGSARSDFDSLVFVAKGAAKSHSQQLGKSLLLSDKARAHVRPQLRIDNDDVSCAHGAAIGHLQKEELFYLRSRGLSEEAARYLLIYGFADEVIGLLKNATLKRQLEGLVRKELNQIAREGNAHGASS